MTLTNDPAAACPRRFVYIVNKNKGTHYFASSVEEPHVLVESTAPANHQAAPNDNSAPSKGSGKKQKNETDKGTSTASRTLPSCSLRSSLTLNPPMTLVF